MWGIRANPISIRKCQSHAYKKSLLEVGLCNVQWDMLLTSYMIKVIIVQFDHEDYVGPSYIDDIPFVCQISC